MEWCTFQGNGVLENEAEKTEMSLNNKEIPMNKDVRDNTDLLLDIWIMQLSKIYIRREKVRG